MQRLTVLLALLLLACAASARDIVLTPVTTSGPEVALILIQGAQIPADRYVSLLQEVQNKSSLSLWVGLPDYLFDVPEPLQLGSGIESMLKKMHKKGLSTSSPLVLAGHSLGGAMVQDWVASNSHQVSAQVLLGSFLTRKYRGQVYPVPTLTVGAELDGLCRITRIAEAYYHQQSNPYPGMAPEDFPVVVVEGANHMQFATGKPPLLVEKRDLLPEITEQQAHDAFSDIIVAFLENRFQGAKAVASGPTFLLDPIVNSLKLEGNYALKPPCYDDPPSDACQVGCPWTEMVSQRGMSGLPEDVSINVTDAFHPVSQIDVLHTPHVHLPQIFNDCTEHQHNCLLQMATVTEAHYELLEGMDTGFVSVSAYELRTKLKSRQASYIAAGYSDTNFTAMDEVPTRCADINQVAVEWALKNGPAKSMARYYSIGRKLVMGDDLGPYNAGPLWIWSEMKYTDKKDKSGDLIREVRAPMMRTPVPYYIEASAGFHYCKVLSPARALEWMMVDSLRDEGALASANSDTVTATTAGGTTTIKEEL